MLFPRGMFADWPVAAGVWRLGVGDWRVLFGRDDGTRTIRVDAVKPRGSAYTP
jgi:mRNA-degrading endonuclease RelE of RelBE toxin-antitoxin system